jgi:endonuclease/exonuclease/phosphatase family metal-dependent hydrolase
MSITITTWNVQNLRRSDPVFADKLNFLVGTVQALGSDVVALQEILDLNALQELANRLGFHHFAAMPDDRENRVAFLTRNAPALEARQIDQWQLAQGIDVRDFDSDGVIKVLPQFPRPAFQITIAHDGEEIDIVTAHLKSKLLTFRGTFSTNNETLRAHTAYFALERRAAEATSLREHATGLLSASRKVVVLGDLNDGPEAATTQILYGPPGSQPRGPEDATQASGAFQRADDEDDQRLFNVTKLVPEKIRWTRRHDGQNELLDHILVSEGLMPHVNGLRKVPEMSILNKDAPNLIGPNPSVSRVISDHAPVTATFA